MVETYGLTQGQPMPSVDDVNAALDANTSAIMDVTQALVNGVNACLKDNADKIDNVVKRLTNSVNGHLRKNTGILKPIGNMLVDHVDGALAQNDAIIQTAASNPAVADFLRSSPSTNGYALSTPTAPAPGTGVPAAPPAPPAGPVSYGVLVNPATSQAVAVPGVVGEWLDPAFRVPAGWVLVTHINMPSAQVAAWLADNAASLLAQARPGFQSAVKG